MNTYTQYLGYTVMALAGTTAVIGAAAMLIDWTWRTCLDARGLLEIQRALKERDAQVSKEPQ